MVALRYQDSEKQIKRFGWRVYNRMRLAGAYSVQIEDIVGELMIAWCEASNRWDESTGVPFGAYLFRGMRNHINRWAQREIDVSNIAPKSMDAETSEAKGDSYDYITMDEPSVEEQVIQKDQAKQVLAALSADARQFLELLQSPPDWLLAELKALQARAQYGRARGLCSSAPKRITMCLIMDAMGVPARKRRDIHLEIEATIARISADSSALDCLLDRLGSMIHG